MATFSHLPDEMGFRSRASRCWELCSGVEYRYRLCRSIQKGEEGLSVLGAEGDQVILFEHTKKLKEKGGDFNQVGFFGG